MNDDDDIQELYECPTKYICVIHFETTCMEFLALEKEFYPHEIIEFPAVLINTRTCSMVSNFHAFVRPVLHPQLSSFCKNLVGISQETVNNAEPFELVFPRFLEWINGCTEGDSFTILTDGPSDMPKFLFLQCLISYIDFPPWADNFIDIKKTFVTYKRIDDPKLVEMLQAYGLTFKGHIHSGKDGAFNIARLVLAMLKSKCHLVCNSEVYAGRRFVSLESCGSGMHDISYKKFMESQLAGYFSKGELKKNKNQNNEVKDQHHEISSST